MQGRFHAIEVGEQPLLSMNYSILEFLFILLKKDRVTMVAGQAVRMPRSAECLENKYSSTPHILNC